MTSASTGLLPGTRLGPYEIVAPIGAGGMGEVYRARDARLGRDVAIKVLPTEMSADPERLRRFELEARAAAALNHPGILAVYDLGTEAGAPFIVSELLEGETLRARLSRGRGTSSSVDGASGISTRKAIDYAVQIAKALSAAHERGIVHRDLKPENLFIMSDGRVKILDFGLAKLTEKAPVPVGEETLLSTKPSATDAGTVLGTMGYMAPEQLRAQAVDHRADLFAFGAVLYEMLSGQRAFRGDTPADTISAILDREPPELPSVGARIPPALARVVDRCLEKAPSARFQSAHDLAFALEALSAQTDSGQTAAISAVSGSSMRSPRRERLVWASLAGVLLVALVGTGVALVRRPTVQAPLMRFSIQSPDGVSLIPGDGSVAVSPDGRQLVFRARSNPSDEPMLWLQPLDAETARVIPGTENSTSPFWSADGQAIGFFADGRLKTVRLSSGLPQIVCDLPAGQSGGSWGRGGDIIIGAGSSGGLLRVPATGGQPVPLTTPDTSRGELSHRRPTFLPDGRHFVFAAQPGTRFYIGSVDSPQTTSLLDAHSQVTYASGHLLFARDRTLFAQAFDTNSLSLSGEPTPLAQGVIVNPRAPGAAFSVSDNGVLAFEVGQGPGSGRFPQRLTWFDRAGKSLGTVGDGLDDRSIELSPDGRRLTEHTHEDVGGGDIWLRDLERSTRTRLSFGGHNTSAVWSPDGSRIVYASNLPASGKPSNDPYAPPFDLLVKPADGGGEARLVLDAVATQTPSLWKLATSWSRDGQFVLFDATGAKTQGDIWLLPLNGDRKPRPWLQTGFHEMWAQFSPDGRFVAYQSNETRRPEIYVRPLTGSGRWSISTDGGRYERWSGDGKELFYVNRDFKLMTVPIRLNGDSIEPGTPQPLFDLHLVAPFTGLGNSGAPFAVSADGKRFLVLVDASPPQVIKPISVMVNWTEALKK